MSVLPDFLLSLRHYVVRVIEPVLEARHEEKLSWAAVKGKNDPENNPDNIGSQPACSIRY